MQTVNRIHNLGPSPSPRVGSPLAALAGHSNGPGYNFIGGRMPLLCPLTSQFVPVPTLSLDGSTHNLNQLVAPCNEEKCAWWYSSPPRDIPDPDAPTGYCAVKAIAERL